MESLGYAKVHVELGEHKTMLEESVFKRLSGDVILEINWMKRKQVKLNLKDGTVKWGNKNLGKSGKKERKKIEIIG